MVVLADVSVSHDSLEIVIAERPEERCVVRVLVVVAENAAFKFTYRGGGGGGG